MVMVSIDHRKFVFFAMVMLMISDHLTFDHKIFEIVAMVMVKNSLTMTMTSGRRPNKWSKDRGRLPRLL